MSGYPDGDCPDDRAFEDLQERWEEARHALAAIVEGPGYKPADLFTRANEFLTITEVYVVDALHLLLLEDDAS